MDKLPHKTTRRFGTSHSASYKIAEWTRGQVCEPVGDRVSSSRRRFFAVVSPPVPASAECKPARRIILFDNHPESLRLAFNIARQFAAEEIISRRREKLNSSICASILLAVLAALMLAPLWT